VAAGLQKLERVLLRILLSRRDAEGRMTGWIASSLVVLTCGMLLPGAVNAGETREVREQRDARAAEQRPAARKPAPRKPARARRPAIDADSLRLQVSLDRAGFSVGEIDGKPGAKTQKALMAFEQARGLSVSDAPNEDTWKALQTPQNGQHGQNGSSGQGAPPPDQATPEPTMTYTITAEDASGPFAETIPKDLVVQGQLEQLAYTSPLEMLSERFHASPRLLQLLNRNAPFTEGTTITVPNVQPLMPPQTTGKRKGADPAGMQAAEVIVSKEHNDVVALDANGVVILYAPVSSGSEHDPLPIGDWIVRGVYLNPRFFYNPDLFWNAESSQTKTKIAPGPNNPVGFVWIDLDRPHYGLHGTPEPSMVGITQSHGCVRLTNWDALRLAALVQEGTKVSFRP
jgi:lipoprotein-anchoring transpeptidase ErfK/SrfK